MSENPKAFTAYMYHAARERDLQLEFLELLSKKDSARKSLRSLERKIDLKRGEKKTHQHLKAQARIAMGITKQAAWQMEWRKLGKCKQCKKDSDTPVCTECREKVQEARRKKAWVKEVYELLCKGMEPMNKTERKHIKEYAESLSEDERYYGDGMTPKDTIEAEQSKTC